VSFFEVDIESERQREKEKKWGVWGGKKGRERGRGKRGRY